MNEYLIKSETLKGIQKVITLFRVEQGSLAGETKLPYIRTLQCAMHGCLKKATVTRSDAIFFLLHCGAKPPNYGLILASFSLACNLGTISLSRVAFHMESEKRAVSSPPLLKLPRVD